MTDRIPDIRFFDFEFRLLHVENRFLSSNWNVYYNDIGNFEAHFDLSSDVLPVIMENHFMIAVQGNHAAVVVGKSLGDDVTVYGRTCNWLLTKRVTNAFVENGSKTLFEVVSQKVKEAFPEAEVVIGDPVSTSLVSAEQSDKCEAFEVIQALLEQEKLGHEIQFDFPRSRFVFRVLKGNDNPQVFSTSNRNAYDAAMSSETLETLTHGLYKQKTENGEVWKEAVLQTPEVSLLKWVGIVSAGSESEAISALAKARETNHVQGKTAGVSFGTDYALGDIVTFQHQAGKYRYSARKRIAGVNLWYESGNIGEEPIFDDVDETETK